jgi:hypothetical protein
MIMKKKILHTLSDEALGRYRDIEYYGMPVVLKHGTSFIRLTSKTKAERMIINSEAGEFYDTIREIGFTPDFSDVIYVAKKEKKEFVVTGKGKHQAFDKILTYTFSKHGKLAYVAEEKKKQFVVIDNKIEPAYDFIDHGFLFDDNEVLHYYANTGGKADKTYFPPLPQNTGQWFYITNSKVQEISHDQVGKMNQAPQWDYESLIYPNFNSRVDDESIILPEDLINTAQTINGHSLAIEKTGKKHFLIFDKKKDEEAFEKIHAINFSKKLNMITVIGFKENTFYQIDL